MGSIVKKRSDESVMLTIDSVATLTRCERLLWSENRKTPKIAVSLQCGREHGAGGSIS